MRRIERTTQFRRDYKRIRRGRLGPKLEEQLGSVLALLVTDQPLPARYVDHALVGQWNGFRDCHVFPDLVLIYEKPDDVLRLIRLGSHSDLSM